jgi:hypothetical protein
LLIKSEPIQYQQGIAARVKTLFINVQDSSMTSLPDHLPSAIKNDSSATLCNARAKTIWIADAHRGDGKRFVVRADDQLTAFLELPRGTGLQLMQVNNPIGENRKIVR